MGNATKTVYVLVGLPLAGKSTYTQQLALEGECLVIERDKFLESINQEPATLARLNDVAANIVTPVSRLSSDPAKNAFNDAVTQEYVHRVTEAIAASPTSTVIVDGTHLQALSRSFVGQLVGTKSIAIVFTPNPSLSIERLNKENLTGVRTTITPELIHRMAEVFEFPTLAEGFDEIVSI